MLTNQSCRRGGEQTLDAPILWSLPVGANRYESMMGRPVLGYRLLYSGNYEQEKAWRKIAAPIFRAGQIVNNCSGLYPILR